MRLVLVLLGLALLFLTPFLLWGETFETLFSPAGAVNWLQGYRDHAWLVAIGLLGADLLLPLPASAVLAALGLLYGPLLGAAIGAFGLWLAGAVGYGLCRALGRGAARALLGERELRRGERWFSRAGPWLVVGSRWLPILPEVIACSAGLARMPAPLFLSALACGCLPVAMCYAWVGHLGVERPGLTLAASALAPPLLWLLVLGLAPVFRARRRSAGLRRYGDD